MAGQNERIDEIGELFQIIKKLQNKFPGKKFTLDGRLVGDIGEVIVQRDYDVILFENMEAIYDGYSGEKKVQIKATFKDTLTFPIHESKVPEYYIGIKLFENGKYEEIYNGPGSIIWEILKNRAPTPNSLHSISISKLKELNKNITQENRIKYKKNKI